jgi:hypothetical protein
MQSKINFIFRKTFLFWFDFDIFEEASQQFFLISELFKGHFLKTVRSGLENHKPRISEAEGNPGLDCKGML